MFGPLYDRRCIAEQTQGTITHMYWSSPRVISAACFIIMLVTIVGCDSQAIDANKVNKPPEGALDGSMEIKIVSLSPALTRIVVDLGFGDLIVGRTRFCKSIDSAVPVIGDHFAVDYESLVRVQPTHILIQPPRNEIPSALAELVNANGWSIHSFKIDTLSDIKNVTKQLPLEIFANAPDRLIDARKKSNEILNALDEISKFNKDQAWNGSVLLVHSIEQSISIFGKDTYLDELLGGFGCTNAAANVTGWAQLTLEDVTRLNPQAILLISSTINNKADSAQAIGVLGELQIDAVTEKRIGILNHPDALLPATSVIEVAEQMRQLLNSFVGSDQ